MPGRSHPLVRRVRALRGDGALRAHEEVFVAEGMHLAREALEAKAAIEAAVASPRLSESIEGRDLARRLRAAGVPTHLVSDDLLESLQDARSPQPVLVVVKRPPVAFDQVVSGRGGTPLLVVACGVQDPGNLGALLRTADAAAATGFVSITGSASLTHPRAVRASMGAIFRVPSIEGPLRDVLRRARGAGLRVYGASPRRAMVYDEADWSGPVALLLGGEGAGLPADAEAALDLRVLVPMAPGVESLSVNAAAAVLLFEAARKRRAINRAG
jgi:TrmH family RNA methyltransferase